MFLDPSPIIKEITAKINKWASQVPPLVKNLPAKAEYIREEGSIPELGTYLGEGHDNPPQYSCLENSMDRGAWQVTLHRVAESQT